MIFICRWDIPALIEKIPKLGAVIDLTNTARYYNPEVRTPFGIFELSESVLLKITLYCK